jgi:L-amino acid N-acyltransferase YncA
MGDSIIRDASPEDGARYAEIYGPYVRETCVSFESDAPSPEEMAGRVAEKQGQGFAWLACEADGEIAGYAYFGPWRARAAYRNTVESAIYLDPRFQGRGLGRILYGALVERARAQGRRAMIGVIALPNGPSEALHEKMGFARVGVYREVGFKFGRWVDIASWELLL